MSVLLISLCDSATLDETRNAMHELGVGVNMQITKCTNYDYNKFIWKCTRLVFPLTTLAYEYGAP